MTGQEYKTLIRLIEIAAILSAITAVACLAIALTA